MNQFEERRGKILQQFEIAKNDLEALNIDIQKTIRSNQEQVQRLSDETMSLLSLQKDNESSIKYFTRLLKS